MKILFDIGHPAHLHLFRNFIDYLTKKNVEYLITSRDKDVTNNLLTHYKYNFVSLSKSKKSFLGLIYELIKRDIQTLKFHRKHKFTHAFGTSVSIAHLSIFTKVKSYNFCEDDDNVVPIQAALIYPFTTKIINPECLRYLKWKNKRILVPSYHELAYLHPNNFIPDEFVLKKYKLVKGKYIIVRFSALVAHHDTNAKGISKELWTEIQSVIADFTIIKSVENEKSHTIAPSDMHHVLAFAKMIICDSQTMAAESMVLGVPSIRINTFVGKISYLEELENQYKLGYGFLPTEKSKIIETINNLINDNNIDKVWQNRKAEMLSDKVDLNKWMIDFFEKRINE